MKIIFKNKKRNKNINTTELRYSKLGCDLQNSHLVDHSVSITQNISEGLVPAEHSLEHSGGKPSFF